MSIEDKHPRNDNKKQKEPNSLQWSIKPYISQEERIWNVQDGVKGLENPLVH